MSAISSLLLNPLLVKEIKFDTFNASAKERFSSEALCFVNSKGINSIVRFISAHAYIKDFGIYKNVPQFLPQLKSVGFLGEIR